MGIFLADEFGLESNAGGKSKTGYTGQETTEKQRQQINAYFGKRTQRRGTKLAVAALGLFLAFSTQNNYISNKYENTLRELKKQPAVEEFAALSFEAERISNALAKFNGGVGQNYANLLRNGLDNNTSRRCRLEFYNPDSIASYKQNLAQMNDPARNVFSLFGIGGLLSLYGLRLNKKEKQDAEERKRQLSALEMK
jgi:hypothetical protein